MTAEHIVDADRRAKDLATLQARLALAGGYALSELAGGDFLVSRWNLTKTFSSLQQVREFCRQVGALD